MVTNDSFVPGSIKYDKKEPSIFGFHFYLPLILEKSVQWFFLLRYLYSGTASFDIAAANI